MSEENTIPHRLREDFLALLRTRLEEMEALGEAGDILSVPAILKLAHVAHQLAGSSGAFGFAPLGASAKSLETALAAAVEEADSGSMAAGTQAHIAAHVESIKSAIRDALAERKDDITAPAFFEPVEQARCTLLIVSEEQEEVSALAQQLTSLGYHVARNTSLHHILQAEIIHQPAAILIVTAFTAPEHNVLETYAALRRKRGHGAPLLYLSSCDDFATRLAAVRLGAAGFASLPIRPFEVIDQLSKLVAPEAAMRYHILLLVEDALLADRYSIALSQEEFTVTVLADPKHTLKTLGESTIDLVVADFDMRGCNGLEFATVLRQLESYAALPMLFLAADVEIGFAPDHTPLGADEFLLKPVSVETLLAAVRARATRAAALQRFMDRDNATGLLTLSRLKHETSLEITRAKRQHSRFSYAMLDLDHFSALGNMFGQQAGDLVIKTLAHLLRRRLRETDMIGRLGVQEFAVLMPDTTPEEALLVLSEVHGNFATMAFNAYGRDFHVTFSGGIAGFPDYLREATLRDAAGQALMEAKRQGRNRLVLAA